MTKRTMQTESHIQHSLFFKALTAGFLFATMLGVSFWFGREIHSLTTQLYTQKIRAASLAREHDEILQLLMNLAGISGNEATIRSGFLSADFIVPFVDALEMLEKKHALTINKSFTDPIATKFSLPSQNTNGARIPLYTSHITLTFDTDARLLQTFLTDLEALPYFFTVTNVTAQTRQTDTDWERALSATINLTLYTQLNQ